MKAVRVLAVMLVLGVAISHAQRRRSTTGSVTIPAGTPVSVRIIDNLNSETAKAGDEFTGTLEAPVTVSGSTVFPKGADVTGRVVSAKKSGRLTDPGVLELAVTSITSGGRTATVNTSPFIIKGESHKKSNITKIGGGAAAGALVGAIAGGGKGAAIGAGVGAAAGTGVAAATGKKNASVESEAVLNFSTSRAVSTTVASSAARVASRSVRSYDERDREFTREEIAAAAREFGDRDRRVIRDCLGGNQAGLPPGLAKRDRLPPGLERQLQRNGKLPPGLQKKVAPLPGVCNARLPRLPRDIERVVLGRRVILLNRAQTILDLFHLDQ